MLAGELYAAFDPALLAARTRAKQLLHRLNVTEYVLTDAARQILAELLPHAGPNSTLEPILMRAPSSTTQFTLKYTLAPR